jgi:hypothetical protein
MDLELKLVAEIVEALGLWAVVLVPLVPLVRHLYLHHIHVVENVVIHLQKLQMKPLMQRLDWQINIIAPQTVQPS